MFTFCWLLKSIASVKLGEYYQRIWQCANGLFSLMHYFHDTFNLTPQPWLFFLLMWNKKPTSWQVILFYVPLEIAWAATVSWWAGDAMCRLMVFLRYPVSSLSHIIIIILIFARIFGFYASGFILIVISLDRWWKNIGKLSLHSKDESINCQCSNIFCCNSSP